MRRARAALHRPERLTLSPAGAISMDRAMSHEALFFVLFFVLEPPGWSHVVNADNSSQEWCRSCRGDDSGSSNSSPSARESIPIGAARARSS